MSSRENPLDACLAENAKANTRLHRVLHTAEETTRFHKKEQEPVVEDAPVVFVLDSETLELRKKRPTSEPEETTLRIVPHIQDAGSAATA